MQYNISHTVKTKQQKPMTKTQKGKKEYLFAKQSTIYDRIFKHRFGSTFGNE